MNKIFFQGKYKHIYTFLTRCNFYERERERGKSNYKRKGLEKKRKGKSARGGRTGGGSNDNVLYRYANHNKLTFPFFFFFLSSAFEIFSRLIIANLTNFAKFDFIQFELFMHGEAGGRGGIELFY